MGPGTAESAYYGAIHARIESGLNELQEELDAHEIGNPFTDGEPLYTAIYFDSETGGFIRRDIAINAWEQEVAERTPFSFWKTQFEPQIVEEKPEITPKENAQALLTRLIEEDDAKTENARYILALMLERKRTLIPTATKEVEDRKSVV